MTHTLGLSDGTLKRAAAAISENKRLQDINADLLTALESIVFGLTNERNCVWPTPKAWTKKERDEAMLNIARAAIAKAT